MNNLIEKIGKNKDIYTIKLSNKTYIRAKDLCEKFHIKNYKKIIQKIDGSKNHKIKFGNIIHISFEGLTTIFPILNENIETIKKYDEIVEKILKINGELYRMNSFMKNDIKHIKNKDKKQEEVDKIKERVKELFVIKIDLSSEQKKLEINMNRIYEVIELNHLKEFQTPTRS
jgi:hypothetical protein